MRLLVAGCGTGKEAIDAALHYSHVEVTAIDLSRTSLAFARRKAEEYGLDNIRFAQEDILELGSEFGPYHVILSSGVLHHMADPAAGLRRLSELLVPSGLMKLGLYSRLARSPLREAARRIRTSGGNATAESIRAFRQQVLQEGPRGALAELAGSTDFYSTSECRDLLFHVQEHQHSLGEIDTMLEANRLVFLGFELPIQEVAENFRKDNPRDESLRDLKLWNDFEERYPMSFRSMYQFWCQRER
jgi:SAM-dependent methyltransferase